MKLCILMRLKLMINKSTTVKNKYNNKKTTIDDIVFDSKDEALYYQALKDMKAKGLIKDFELQPEFILQEGFEKDEKKYRAIKYTADFRVLTNNDYSYIVDVKGMLTTEFKIKMKLFNYKYPDIELRLISRSIKYGDEYGFIDYYELQKIRKQNKK